MRALLALSFLFAALPSWANDDIGCVDTAFKLLGSNHKVCVQAINDPDVPGVTCHLSYAKTGGIKGSVGLAEDPSRFSIACRQTGPISAASIAKLPKDPQLAFAKSSSLIFKKTRLYRMHDAKRGVLVYVAISDRLIEGSPDNSISTIPLFRPAAAPSSKAPQPKAR